MTIFKNHVIFLFSVASFACVVMVPELRSMDSMDGREQGRDRDTAEKRGVKRKAPGKQVGDSASRIQRVIRGLQAVQQGSEEENKENYEPAGKGLKIDPDSKTTNQRPTYLRKIFTRNPLKLNALIENAINSPARQGLIKEAQSMTGFLTSMYNDQFESSMPEEPTPLRDPAKHTRKKTKSLSRDGVRRNIAQHFDDRANWSAVLTYPAEGTTGARIIYQRDGIFDPLEVVLDDEGNEELNLARMARGAAPRGVDGRSVELHHLLRAEPGPLAEITSSFHRRETGVLHFPSDPLADRSNYDRFRPIYWQMRAFDIRESWDLQEQNAMIA